MNGRRNDRTLGRSSRQLRRGAGSNLPVEAPGTKSIPPGRRWSARASQRGNVHLPELVPPCRCRSALEQPQSTLSSAGSDSSPSRSRSSTRVKAERDRSAIDHHQRAVPAMTRCDGWTARRRARHHSAKARCRTAQRQCTRRTAIEPQRTRHLRACR